MSGVSFTGFCCFPVKTHLLVNVVLDLLFANICHLLYSCTVSHTVDIAYSDVFLPSGYFFPVLFFSSVLQHFVSTAIKGENFRYPNHIFTYIQTYLMLPWKKSFAESIKWFLSSKQCDIQQFQINFEPVLY